MSRGSGMATRSVLPVNSLDHKTIVAISQSCTEDLDTKLREKNVLAKALSDLKKQKMQYDAKIAKKQREVDNMIVQTLELEKKSSTLQNGNKMVFAEVAGVRADSERLVTEVEHLKKALAEANTVHEKECVEVEKLKQMLHTYRKEISTEAKHRENVQQDLRASRTAQSLMINRLDNMEKRNRALKTCVADTFST